MELERFKAASEWAKDLDRPTTAIKAFLDGVKWAGEAILERCFTLHLEGGKQETAVSFEDVKEVTGLSELSREVLQQRKEEERE